MTRQLRQELGEEGGHDLEGKRRGEGERREMDYGNKRPEIVYGKPGLVDFSVSQHPSRLANPCGI